MLQMNCSNCKGVISSPFLADISTIECGQCKENVPVKDVFITTEHFTVPRDDFADRTFRFQKLLRDVEKERLLLAESKEVSAEKLEKLDQFSSSLKELLVGSRDSYRMDILCDLFVDVIDGHKKRKGKLVNLSTDGGSIEFEAKVKIPRKRSELKLDFSFPESSESFHIDAKVVWTKEQAGDNGPQNASIGVAFVDIEKKTRSCIWDYILDNAEVPFQVMSR